MTHPVRIGEILVAANVITAAQLNEALELQEKRPGRVCHILMSLGHLTESDLLKLLTSDGGRNVPSLDPYIIDPKLTEIVPESVARPMDAMPLLMEADLLTVGLGGPYGQETRTFLEKRVGLTVRPVLCSPPTIRAAIAQYYPSGSEGIRPGVEALRLRNLLHIVNTIDGFPTLPDTHLLILNQLDDPDTRIDELTESIQQDAGLSANIMRMANSAAYARRYGYASVSEAVLQLGFKAVKDIVMSSAVIQQCTSMADFNVEPMFHDAFRCGLLTKILADTLRLSGRDTAFTAGLLANIGRIALCLYSQESSRQLAQAAEGQAAELVDVEAEWLGASTSELGYLLGSHWGLPENLRQIIRFHDRLDRASNHSPLTMAVGVADHCIQHETQDALPDPGDDQNLRRLLTRLGINRGEFEKVASAYAEARERETRHAGEPA